VASPALWAATYGRKDIVYQPLDPPGSLAMAWASPDGRYAYGLAAVDATIFFSTQVPGKLYESFAWTEQQGVQPLLAFPDAAGGGSCCVLGDGNELVWLQGSVWQPATKTYATVDLMWSPYATSAAQLAPKKLRTTFGDSLVGTWGVIGGGHALLLEMKAAETQGRLVLTRLADGAWWDIPVTPGFTWGRPLYVDAEELGVAKDALKEVFLDAGLQSGHDYSIVRLRIDSLGPPNPPE
jgi:hypothetical protein